jgi:hypothetical protein
LGVDKLAARVDQFEVVATIVTLGALLEPADHLRRGPVLGDPRGRLRAVLAQAVTLTLGQRSAE